MSELDDAIREHLELKRLRGADPMEVARLEREALGSPLRDVSASIAIEYGRPAPEIVEYPAPAIAERVVPFAVTTGAPAVAMHPDGGEATQEFRVDEVEWVDEPADRAAASRN